MTEKPFADEYEDRARARRAVILIYILYFIGFATGVSALAGAIIAHSKSGELFDAWESHLQFQIRTFWFGLAMLIVGGLLALVIIGYAILLWWMIWTAVRCIKGLMAAMEDRPIEDPMTLMW